LVLDAAQPKISTQFPVDKRKTLPKEEKLIVDFTVKGIHPLSIVEEEGFKNLVKGEEINIHSSISFVTGVAHCFNAIKKCNNKLKYRPLREHLSVILNPQMHLFLLFYKFRLVRT
jgi:NRPS condensation-like uncharacterized protein